MAYNQGLAVRVETLLDELHPSDLVSKKMFGGVGYMVRGNMACGIHKDKLIVRVGKDAYLDALGQPGAGVFDITGRPMTGWIILNGCIGKGHGLNRLGGKGIGIRANPASEITHREKLNQRRERTLAMQQNQIGVFQKRSLLSSSTSWLVACIF